MGRDSVGHKLMEMFDRMYDKFGPQNWWPAESPFEVIVGAVLTQNTNWKNVEKAISNLKRNSLMDISSLYYVDIDTLSQMIRPAGYYNIKAKRLKELVRFIYEEFDADLNKMFDTELWQLREQLLQVKGIGPETVDSILLYAGSKPIFVVDAYTKRIFSRHNLCFEDVDYHQLQSFIMESIDEDVNLYNEFHALLVCVGKSFCKKNKPLCRDCPLAGL